MGISVKEFILCKCTMFKRKEDDKKFSKDRQKLVCTCMCLCLCLCKSQKEDTIEKGKTDYAESACHCICNFLTFVQRKSEIFPFESIFLPPVSCVEKQLESGKRELERDWPLVGFIIFLIETLLYLTWAVFTIVKQL